MTAQNGISYVYVAVMTGCLIWMFWCLWGIICNGKTLDDRTAIIDRVHGFMAVTRQAEQYWAMRREFAAVSYDKHLKARMRLKNWRKLYGPLTQEVMGWTDGTV